MTYHFTGRVIDEHGLPLPGVFVESYSIHLGLADDYLGNGKTDTHGIFTITFEENAMKGVVEYVERFFHTGLDVYFIIRDSFHEILRTGIFFGAKDGRNFEISVKQNITYVDPYSNSIQRELAAFNTIGDTIDISEADPARLSTQLIRIVSSTLYYSNPDVMQLYGYAGPQVPRYGKKIPHRHTLPWNEKKDIPEATD